MPDLIPLLFVMELPLSEVGQLLLVTGISFTLITLIASASRFHHLIQIDETKLPDTESCDRLFQIQISRYLSRINRISSGFSIAIIRLETDPTDLRTRQEKALKKLKNLLRNDTDKACLLHTDCIAAIFDAEEENADAIAQRIRNETPKLISSLSGVTSFHAGIATFPTHALNSIQLIEAAESALEQARAKGSGAVEFATLPEEGEETEEPKVEKVGELTKEDKNASLDPLTGVLKPKVIGSYFRKYLLEIRRKKKPVSLFFIELNKPENLKKIHGESSVDAAIQGVSELLKTLCREYDLIGRIDHHHFLIMAPCALEHAEPIAIRLRDAVRDTRIPFEGKNITTSIRIGLSGHPEHGNNLRELSRGAQAALNEARHMEASACIVYDPEKHNKGV